MNPATDFHIGRQIFWLAILGVVIACISRTVIFEEIFREPREWFEHRCHTARNMFQRKFFYLFTCEYCFSHYVTAIVLIATRFRLLIDDWRGYILAFFTLVFIANAFMNLYGRLRLDIQQAKVEIKTIEKKENVKA
jgi:uncharacterized membrane protein